MIQQRVKLKFLLLSLACLLSANALAADTPKGSGKSIVKWVDEKGVTHYGDSVPPQYANRDTTLINSQGRVVKQTPSVNINQQLQQQQPSEDRASIEQQRRDRALRAYRSEKEIDEARDRSLQLDQATMQALQENKSNIQNRMDSNAREVETLKKKGKPLPNDLKQDIARNQQAMARVDEQMKQRKEMMDKTHQKYDDDKSRFRELALEDQKASASQPKH